MAQTSACAFPAAAQGRLQEASLQGAHSCLLQLSFSPFGPIDRLSFAPEPAVPLHGHVKQVAAIRVVPSLPPTFPFPENQPQSTAARPESLPTRCDTGAGGLRGRKTPSPKLHDGGSPRRRSSASLNSEAGSPPPPGTCTRGLLLPARLSLICHTHELPCKEPISHHRWCRHFWGRGCLPDHKAEPLRPGMSS